MLTQYIRVFKRLVAVMTDVSLINADKSGILVNQDYVYIAQKFPFMSLYFQMKVVNATANCVPKLEYWNGTEWITAVDVLDYTKGLVRSGLIQYSLTEKESWQRISETTADNSNCPTELQGLHVSDCYWLRLSHTPAVNALTEIKRISYAFTTTDKINSIDIGATDHYESIGDATGEVAKASWENEILSASELMVSEMKSASLIKSSGQIIEMDDFYIPCAFRTLALIYSNLGEAYQKKLEIVMLAYSKFLSGPMTLDKDKDGRISTNEITTSQSRLYR